jgi:pre-mRNA-splicing factor RBM22/SLT11
MLDLSFGLPIVVRDAALKMVAPGPSSGINREYYAQEHERELEEGRGDTEAYEKTDEKARDLLRRLANSEPYYKKQRRIGATEGDNSNTAESNNGQKLITPGPIRTRDSRGGKGGMSGSRGTTTRGGRGGGQGSRTFPSTAQLPPGPRDIMPPNDRSITSLFLTGVEDDLPEHTLRTFFSTFGTLRSVVCSHRSHCAFVNYASRASAEAAAESCQGKAVIQGCPLRVQWGRPRPLDNMDQEERDEAMREGRAAIARDLYESGRGGSSRNEAVESGDETNDPDSLPTAAPPPGQDDVQYASMAGN